MFISIRLACADDQSNKSNNKCWPAEIGESRASKCKSSGSSEMVRPGDRCLLLALRLAVHLLLASGAAASRPPAGRQDDSEQQQPDEYLIGAGIADITGPAADINLMGYAKPNQDAGGIHLRQFSRALMVEDQEGRRLVYVSIDNGMVSQLLRTSVLAKLERKFGGQVLNESNVMISGESTATCSGPLCLQR